MSTKTAKRNQTLAICMTLLDGLYYLVATAEQANRDYRPYQYIIQNVLNLLEDMVEIESRGLPAESVSGFTPGSWQHLDEAPGRGK